MEGAVCSDHVHICVSIPPKLSVSEFVGYLKGKSALMIHDKHPELTNKQIPYPPITYPIFTRTSQNRES